MESMIILCLFFISLAVEASQAFSFSIESKSWQYKGRHHIGYEVANSVTSSTNDNKNNDDDDDRTNNSHQTPILILNGFGVGSFHQHRLMPNLVCSSPNSDGNNDGRTVYGVDYLGQGRSWPIDCNDGNSENEKGLIYSIDTWTDQIIEFIETIIIPNHYNDDDQQKSTSTKVHLIGNSVGGHLSAILAAKRPDLIESICLLNATPVWGLNLPGWDGVLPPPYIPRQIGRYLFDQIRDLNTIEKYLDNAYYYRDAFDEELMGQIRACTEGKGGHAAFASILWSPPTGQDKDFYNILKQVECDVLLLFGKNDPWCTPAFAKRMFQSLHQRKKEQKDNKAPIHRYVELENVGHCPNHEAPQAVGSIASLWTSSDDRGKDVLDLLECINASDRQYNEDWGHISARELGKEEADLTLMERIITSLV